MQDVKQPLQQQTLEASLGMAPAAETAENANKTSKDAVAVKPNKEIEPSLALT